MPNWENGIRQSSRKHHGNCKGYFGTAPKTFLSTYIEVFGFNNELRAHYNTKNNVHKYHLQINWWARFL